MNFCRCSRSRRSPATAAEDDPFCILYTSGTTGRLKGAILTHFGAIHSCLHYVGAFGLREGERTILAVPASHVTGVIAIIQSTICVAGRVLIMPTFKARAFLELAAAEKATYTLIVPGHVQPLSPGSGIRTVRSLRLARRRLWRRPDA